MEMSNLADAASTRTLSVECTLDKARNGVHITASVRTDGKTGVEMEALTGIAHHVLPSVI
jgi:molybdenum cofactor biosynthesis enzyme